MDEKKLIELQKEKEYAHKRLLNLEIVLGAITTISFLTILFMSLYAILNLNLYVVPIIMIVVAVAIFVVGMTFCVLIEQKAGYYECRRCHQKHVPTFSQAMFAPHCFRTKYMKCPHCKQKSWNKKVIK